MFKLILIFIILIPSFLLSQIPCDHVKGELLIGVADGVFNFPAEYYASKVSFMYNINEVQIDSLVRITLKKGLYEIDHEKTLSFRQQESIDPDLSNRLNIKLTTKMHSVFKEIGVYYIGRNVKVFSPQDTLLHLIINRLGKDKMVK